MNYPPPPLLHIFTWGHPSAIGFILIEFSGTEDLFELRLVLCNPLLSDVLEPRLLLLVSRKNDSRFIACIAPPPSYLQQDPFLSVL